MVTRPHYVGGSSGFSFPILHTGIRYRVGSFRGEPVHQKALKKLGAGTFVVTNQRAAHVGRTKATGVALAKVMHVEVYKDGLSIARGSHAESKARSVPVELGARDANWLALVRRASRHGARPTDPRRTDLRIGTDSISELAAAI